MTNTERSKREKRSLDMIDEDADRFFNTHVKEREIVSVVAAQGLLIFRAPFHVAESCYISMLSRNGRYSNA